MANTISSAIEQQEWLEPVETGVQKAVSAALNAAGPASDPLKNLLHGVWLGHPLHPALVAVPLGSWTAAAVLDAMDAAGHGRCGAAADVAIKVGLAGAAASAITGLADWQATDGRARRKGIVHGLLNLTATALYAASLLERGRKNRGAGRALAWGGFAISGVAGYLGGELVFTERIGVTHAQETPSNANWATVGQLASLPEGKPSRAEANGAKVCLVREGDEVRAIGEVCSHLGGPLAEGTVEDGTVRCPWHGSRFCLHDGSVAEGPATAPVPEFEVRTLAGTVEVRPKPAA